MDYLDALADIDGRQPESMPGPSLERIAEVVKLLDHPELTYPTIHLTGTNGKTTTARLVTSVACAHGLSTGTYTSPHLGSVTERLTLCAAPISPEEFAEAYAHLEPYLRVVDERSTFAGGIRVTYFEALTALAYLWFADKPVGLGVFEVGLGGSWDATNLIVGDVAVLCPIGLDHTKTLGDTVGAIAAEKAGILKEGKVGVIRQQRREAMEAIERRAGDVGARLLLEGRDFELASRAPAVAGQSFDVNGLHADYEDLFVPLFGEPAARNAAAAVVAVEALLGRPLDVDAVRQGLSTASSPGRIEAVARHPLVVLDGAHNPDAAAALARALPEAFGWKDLHLVVGCFQDKDVREVARVLGPLAARGYACRNSSPRSSPPGIVAAAMRDAAIPHVEAFDTAVEAVDAARAAAGEDDLILVTGSFYTVADVRPVFVAGA